MFIQVNFYHGQSIISACLEQGIVESVYPLQNKVKMSFVLMSANKTTCSLTGVSEKIWSRMVSKLSGKATGGKSSRVFWRKCRNLFLLCRYAQFVTLLTKRLLKLHYPTLLPSS